MYNSYSLYSRDVVLYFHTYLRRCYAHRAGHLCELETTAPAMSVNSAATHHAHGDRCDQTIIQYAHVHRQLHV